MHLTGRARSRPAPLVFPRPPYNEPMPMDELERKRALLRQELQRAGGLMVAFSGGADSAFLLAAAVEALGKRVVAATGVSPSLAQSELAGARAFAAELGVRHLCVPTHEGERPGYLRNGPDRCYFCKDELFGVLGPLAELEGLALAVGTNLDDLGDWRPGQRAAAEHGVLTPLVAAGFRKADVREASRRMGLRTADKPAAACLASRVAYGIAVTPARLSRVERAEALLRSFGVAQLRVRDHGELARVEVPLEWLPKLAAGELRQRLAAGLRELGWRFVTLDLEGFRSGSMNAGLRDLQAPAGSAPPAGGSAPPAGRRP